MKPVSFFLWLSVILAHLALAHADEAPPPRADIQALQFTSDHRLLRENTEDILASGQRYPEVQWLASPRRNAPITHTGGESVRIKIKITLSLVGMKPETPFELRGTSAEAALCFRKEGKVPADKEVVLDLESDKPLGRLVRKIKQKIAWTLTIQPGTKAAATLELANTGPHVVYVTLGTPQVSEDPLSAVTDIRMELAVQQFAAAMKKAGPSASSARILHEFMKRIGGPYLPSRHYPRKKAWKVPESWTMKPPGASCVSIAEFGVLACHMIGIEGTASTGAYYAKPDEPRKAVFGGLGDPPITKKVPGGETWQLFLVDENNSNQGQVAGVGGMNYYEAVVEYQWKNKTFYFPAGSERVFDNPEQVLKVFRTLAWAHWDDQVGDWVVMEVVQTYVAAGEERPDSVPLP